MRISIALTVVFGLLAATPALAAKVRVPQDHPTIQDAVDAAADGDTVVVRAGTYAEVVTIDGRNNLKIQGKGRVIVDPPPGVGQSRAVIVAGSSGVTLQGLRIVAALTGVDAQTTSDLLVQKCTIEAPNGVATLQCLRPVVSRCKLMVTSGIAVRFSTSDTATVARCKISVMTADGQAITSLAVADLEVDRCSISHSVAPTDDSSELAYTSSLTFTRNRITSPVDLALSWHAVYSENSVVPANVTIDVSKNRITGFGGGLRLRGSQGAVASNRVTSTGENCAVDLTTIDTDVTKNRVTVLFPNHDALDLGTSSADCRVTKNRVVGGDAGIDLHGSGHTVDRNKVKGAVIGLDIGGSDQIIGPKNKFTDCDTDIDDGGTGTIYL